MLRLPDAWIWDFWLADTGSEYHLFFLRASRALGDPDRRHRRASVGHAVSQDLVTWELVVDALVPGDSPSFDDLATWTGSVVEGADGTWRMFYTGCSRAENGAVQRIGVATSTDLYTWHTTTDAVCEADPRWYVAAGEAPEIHWRDPWVFPAPDGSGWHMLITARGRGGTDDDSGVIGHAFSPDLDSWQVREPLSVTGSGFDQTEVAQVELVDGRAVLLFSCLGANLSHPRQAAGTTGGTWAVAADGLLGPFDVAAATVLLDERYYSGRLVRDRDGQWRVLAFHNREPDGSFDGRLSDPMPVGWLATGALGLQ